MNDESDGRSDDDDDDIEIKYKNESMEDGKTLHITPQSTNPRPLIQELN
jgi:hypothetical protein